MPPAILRALREVELALIEMILSHLDCRSLARCGSSAKWLLQDAHEVAEHRIASLIQNNPTVARWRRSGTSVLQEAHHIECASRYLPRVAGRYRLDHRVVLDVAPTGEYVNYSTGSLDSPGHCFRGVATVAGVLPSPDATSIDLLYKFDRGYSACLYRGRQIPAEDLPFVGPDYRCFSVSALREGGVRDGRSCPALYENEPGPQAEIAWAVLAGSASVQWKPLAGEYGPEPGAPEVPHAPEPALSPRVLKRVAERLVEWGTDGLAPLLDTRFEGARVGPAVFDFEPALCDLRPPGTAPVAAPAVDPVSGT